MTRLAFAAGLLVCSVAACGSTDQDYPAPSTLDDVLDRPLDELSPAEGRLVCEAQVARTNPCQVAALESATEAECSDKLVSCDVSERWMPECGPVDLGAPGTCSITVAEYLQCIDDWNQAQTCATAQYALPAPASCKKVLAACVQFAGQFERAGPPQLCDETTVPDPPDTDDDIHGLDGCRPTPARFVVLGDGIGACVGTSEEHCTPNDLVTHLAALANDDVTLTVHAAPGATGADLVAQAAGVEDGPGHVLVYVATIETDFTAPELDVASWSAALNQVFAYFTNPTRFPDGATFLLNSHYSLYDRCPNPIGSGTGIPLEQEELLRSVNRQLFLDAAEQRSDTVAIDHYPDFLGHARNANIHGCHCQANNLHWLSYTDSTHPNSLGYKHMTAKWLVVFDQMYAQTCGS
jgi:hypothetical protein